MKNRELFRDFKWFMKLLGKRKGIYLLAIISMTAAVALQGVIESIMIQQIFDNLDTADIRDIIMIVGITTILHIGTALVWRQATLSYNVEAKRGTAKVRSMVNDKMLKLPMSYFEENHSGDYISKLLYDVNWGCEVYASRLRRVIAPIISVAIFYVPMLILSWQITLCLTAVNIVLLLTNSMFVGPMRENSKKRSEENAIMTERLSNILAGMSVTKITRCYKIMIDKYIRANDEFTKLNMKNGILGTWLSVINTGGGLLCSLVFLGLGVFFVSKGYVTVGALVAIYSMYSQFSYQFRQLGRSFPEMVSCLVCVHKLFVFLETKEEPETYEMEYFQSDSYIEFRNISFQYNEDRKVLDNFTAKIQKGETVAVTGTSGSGKSTIAKLLMGFYRPQSGSIVVDGKTIKELGLFELRDRIAYVAQEPYLYDISIAENIRYGNKDASMDEIIAAARAANADEFIKLQPKGYDTVAGERGGKLSGGERQRISIARAILKNAPILLLDEATSALDNKSEALVQEAMKNLMKNRTTIIIAHRPSTIASADREIHLTGETVAVV